MSMKNFPRPSGGGKSRKRGYGGAARVGYSTDCGSGHHPNKHKPGLQRHPPGLRGRDIGLWYARQYKERKMGATVDVAFAPGVDNTNSVAVACGTNHRPRKQYMTDDKMPVIAVPQQQLQNMEKLLEDCYCSLPFEYGRMSYSRLDCGTSETRWRLGKNVDESIVLENSEIKSDIGAGELEEDVNNDNGADYVHENLADKGVINDYQNPSTSIKMEPKDEPPDLDEEALATDDDDDMDIECIFESGCRNVAGQGRRMASDAFISNPLERSERLDMELIANQREKLKDCAYLKMKSVRDKLPAAARRQKIIDAIKENQIVVISGETGCGKSTQVPQFIVEDAINAGNGSLSFVVVTQPRRISAISLAERVAEERAEPLGCSSGYQIRLDCRLPRSVGSVLFCTTGIVLRWLMSDQNLRRVSHLVLDEIHERDVTSDFLIIIIRELLQRRPDLKLILMSATLDAEKFASYFHDAPIVHIPGFMHEVVEYYLEDAIEVTGFRPERPHSLNSSGRPIWKQRSRLQAIANPLDEAEKREAYLHYVSTLGPNYSLVTKSVLSSYNEGKLELPLILELTRHILNTSDQGAILIFLPGWADISEMNKLFLKDPQLGGSGRLRIIPLHSMIPHLDQKAVFDRPPPGIRKIVISTQLAETSITIDDVVYVIDCGKLKMSNFDPALNVQTLQPEWVSLANAHQRRGRAGRVQPGVCYHLYTRWRESILEPYMKPEMLRMRLENLCLQIKNLDLGDCISFLQKAMEPPPLQSLQLALDELYMIGALDSAEQLTILGRYLAELPVDPHCGKMMIWGAMFKCLDPILTIAAVLDFKDPFVTPMGMEKAVDSMRAQFAAGTKSDHLGILNAYQDWEQTVAQSGDSAAYRFCWKNFLSLPTLKMLRKMKDQFASALCDMGFITSTTLKDPVFNKHSGSSKILTAVIAASLHPKIAYVSKNRPWSKRTLPPVCHILRPGLDLSAASPSPFRRVDFHPKSVLKQEKVVESRCLAYHVLVKSNGLSLHDASAVSPMALILLCGNLDTGDKGDTSYEGGYQRNIIIIDDYVHFPCEPSISRVLIFFRRQLDQVIEMKLAAPDKPLASCNANVLDEALKLIEADYVKYPEY